MLKGRSERTWPGRQAGRNGVSTETVLHDARRHPLPPAPMGACVSSVRALQTYNPSRQNGYMLFFSRTHSSHEVSLSLNPAAALPYYFHDGCFEQPTPRSAPPRPAARRARHSNLVYPCALQMNNFFFQELSNIFNLSFPSLINLKTAFCVCISSCL